MRFALPDLLICAALLGLHSHPLKASPLLSFKDLLEIAEQEHFSLKEKELSFENSKQLVTKTRAELLPTLSVESAASLTKNESDSSAWSSSASLILKQNLFDGGSNWTEFQQSRHSRDSQSLLVAQAKNDLTYNLLVSYVEYSQKFILLKASKRKLELLETQIDLVSRQFKQGLKKQRDYRLLEAEVQRAKLAIERAENDFFESQRKLESFIGSQKISINEQNLQILTSKKILDSETWKTSDLKFNLHNDNNNVKAQKLSVKNLELAESQAKREFWPTLNLFAQVNHGAPNFIGSNSSDWSRRLETQTSLGVSLNWKIWNWGADKASIAIAKTNRLLEEKKLNQTILESWNTFKNLKQKIERSQKIIAIQKHIRELEQKSIEETQKEYREGRMGYLDLISGIERDIQSEINFEYEAFDYLISMAGLLKLKGTLHERAKTF